MSQANVLGLVALLSDAQADATASLRYYQDLVYELGEQRFLWMSNSLPGQVPNADGLYTLPNAVIDMIGATYDGHWLDVVDQRTIESLDMGWRARKGDPQAVVYFGESSMSYRLYPQPAQPAVTLTVYVVENRVDLQVWLDLALAYGVLAKEFKRESTHRDEQYAGLCDELHRLFLSFLA